MNSNPALLIDLNIYYVQCLVKDLLRPLQRVTFQDTYSLWSDTFSTHPLCSTLFRITHFFHQAAYEKVGWFRLAIEDLSPLFVTEARLVIVKGPGQISHYGFPASYLP